MDVHPEITPPLNFHHFRDTTRTTRHEGYALSIKHRKRIDLRRENDPPDRFLIHLTFGWAKTVGSMAQTVYRGIEPVRSRFILAMAANNLARLPRLLGA